MQAVIQAARPYSHELLPQPECEKLPYYSALKYIRQRLEADASDFPENKCNTANWIVSHATELEGRAGFYRLENHRSKTLTYHAWNYDKERGLYVDITQDQFNWTTAKAPPIAITRETDPFMIYMPVLDLREWKETIAGMPIADYISALKAELAVLTA